MDESESTADMDLSKTPVRLVGVIEAEVDGDIVIMSPTDFSYFGSSASGRAIWDLIDDQRSLDQIVAELARRYEGDSGVIEAETMEFIDALAAAGLVELK